MVDTLTLNDQIKIYVTSDIYDITERCSVQLRLATGRRDAGLGLFGALYLKKKSRV